jgi:hypothetical protein
MLRITFRQILEVCGGLQSCAISTSMERNSAALLPCASWPGQLRHMQLESCCSAIYGRYGGHSGSTAAWFAVVACGHLLS